MCESHITQSPIKTIGKINKKVQLLTHILQIYNWKKTNNGNGTSCLCQQHQDSQLSQHRK